MEGGCEFPRGTLVVEVVGFSAPRQGDVAAMMKVVVPDRIEAVPTFGGPTDEFGILRLAATMTISRSRAAARAHRVSSCDDVLVGIVENLLRGVEAQPVEVEFADPVAAFSRTYSRTGAQSGPSKFSARPHSIGYLSVV
jgi:hypothetical protein